jgi:hypothetical protein
MKANKKILGFILFMVGFLLYFSTNVFASCHGSGLKCENITHQFVCDNSPGCSWSGGACSGTLSPGVDCVNITDSFACEQTSGVCTWSIENFSFYGYTYKTNGEPLNGTNVTVQIYVFSQQGPPSLHGEYSTLSNDSGFFNLTLPGNNSYHYKPIVRHFNGSDVDYVGKSLPEFPYMEFSHLNAEIKFYLWEGATINLTVFGLGGEKNFTYMVKDTKLGYPVDELVGEGVSVAQRTIYLPANRNYSIMVFPKEAFPFSYEIDNLSSYNTTPIHIDLRLNASEKLIWVSGYATLNGLGAGFDNLYVLGYILEPGDMVFYDWPIPCNISSWRRNETHVFNESDYFNATSGFYNLTLIGSAQGSNILLYAIAKNGSTYYGAYRNISLTATSLDIIDFNFSLQPLLGSVVTNISCEIFGAESLKIETKAVKFRLQNASGTAVNSAHLSVEVDYSTFNSAKFSWMTDISQENNGTVTLPLLNSSIEMQIFTPGFAPLSTTKTVQELSAEQVNITLTQFNPGGIDEVFSDLFIDMLVNNDTCNVPYPPQGCSLLPQTNFTHFNPLSIVIGGGEMSFRMTKLSNNITVHYKNVDLLASGPPDVLFDSSANITQNQTVIEQAWRFGSTGPEIYSSVLLGMPYSDSEINDSANITVLIEKLYDDNWQVIWDASVNTTDQIPEKYLDFDMQWFNTTTNGVLCSKTNSSAAMCYVNTTDNMVWIQIPHFSGLGPNLYGEAPTIQTYTIPLFQGWNLISVPLGII